MLLNFPFGKSMTLKKKIFPVLFNFLFGRLFPWIMIYGTRGAQLVPRIAVKTWRISFPSFDKEIMFKITKTFRREHQKSFLPKMENSFKGCKHLLRHACCFAFWDSWSTWPRRASREILISSRLRIWFVFRWSLQFGLFHLQTFLWKGAF